MGYGVEKQGGNKSGNLRCCSGGDLCSKCGACPAPLSCRRGSLADPVLQSSPTHGAFSASASLPGTCQGRGCRDALPIKGTQSFWLCLFPPFPLLQALGQEWREHLGQDGEMCQRGKQGKLMQNGMVKFSFKRVFLLAVPQIIQVTAPTISPGSQGFSPCREFLQISRAVVEFCFLLALQPNPRQDVRIAAEPSKKPQSFHTSDPAQNPAFFQDCRSESRRFLVQGFLESAFVAVIMNQG